MCGRREERTGAEEHALGVDVVSDALERAAFPVLVGRQLSGRLVARSGPAEKRPAVVMTRPASPRQRRERLQGEWMIVGVLPIVEVQVVVCRPAGAR